MIKAYSNARNRCYLHPHRPAEKKCERCNTGLCDECVHEYRDHVYCENCVDELTFIEATKPTFRDRVREFFRSLRNTLIAIGVVVIICGALFYAFRGLMNQPITPVELARFRYAAAGTFQTPEGVNVNSTVLGAKIFSATSYQKGYEPLHVINEYTGDNFPGWRSANAAFPQDIIVEQQNATAITKVILTQQPTEPRSTWVKEFEVQASTEGPDRGYVTIGKWQLRQVNGPQKFTFPLAKTKWLRLRILSNYGSTQYTSLGEFDAYVVPKNPPGPRAPQGVPGMP